MNKSKISKITLMTLAVLTLSVGSIALYQQKYSTEKALLSLIRNDISEFQSYLKEGGSIHALLPEIDGQQLTVAQGISYFERTNFADYLHQQKIPYVKQQKEGFSDILMIAVRKNNLNLFNKLALEKPDFNFKYSNKEWTLLHAASAWCSQKVIHSIYDQGNVGWDTKAKDGSTPLFLAAEKGCLPVLSFFKAKGADFHSKDQNGRSPLSILRGKKDVALAPFVQLLEGGVKTQTVIIKREVASIPNFYKKRSVPKEQIVDHAAMLEPEDRPLEATETALNSEFAD